MVAACSFPSPRGSQVLIRCVAEGLAERGHEVHLLTYPPDPKSPADPIAPDSGTLRWRPIRAVGRLPKPISPRRWLLDVRMARELFSVVRSEAIDVIHAHNYHGQWIAYPVGWLTGVPVVYHAHNVLADELPWYTRSGPARCLLRAVGEILDRTLPRLAAHVIAITSPQSGYLRSHGVDGRRITTIPPRVRPMVSAPTGAGADLFPGRFVVLYAGNQDGYQNLDLLDRGFAAFRARVPEALLVHAALGDESGGTVVACPESVGVKRLVTASPADQAALWSRADVLVCPRTSWSGFPIKLIHYLAAGRAILVSDGAAAVIADGDTGLLFRRDDADSLAAQLQRLYEDPGLRQRLGERAQRHARRFSELSDASLQLEAVYRTLRPVVGASRARRSMFQGLIGFHRERISARAGRPTVRV